MPVPVTPPQQVSPEQQAAAEKLGLPVTITNSIGMQLVLIPAGEFMMGSGESSEELARMYAKWEAEPEWFAREHPQHRVRITRPFYLGMHEVTVGTISAVCGGKELSDRGGAKWSGRLWLRREQE